MILTGQEIINQVNEGKIKIFPFSLKQINPNSYNFRLGNIIKYYANHILDPKIKQEAIQIEIPSEGLVLYPDKIYLGHSVEVIGSNYYVPMIKGRSSIARMGLFIHITSDIIDIGSHNQWTLQLYAVQPVRIYSEMLIGQATFWEVYGEIDLYDGKYQGTTGPCESLIYKDFSDQE
jgi:dCTP deaminase